MKIAEKNKQILPKLMEICRYWHTKTIEINRKLSKNSKENDGRNV
jgi:hypothetical protein